MKMNPPMVLIFFKFPQMEKGGIPKNCLSVSALVTFNATSFLYFEQLIK